MFPCQLSPFVADINTVVRESDTTTDVFLFNYIPLSLHVGSISHRPVGHISISTVTTRSVLLSDVQAVKKDQ